jgi:hypothetical protein
VVWVDDVVALLEFALDGGELENLVRGLLNS